MGAGPRFAPPTGYQPGGPVNSVNPGWVNMPTGMMNTRPVPGRPMQPWG